MFPPFVAVVKSLGFSSRVFEIFFKDLNFFEKESQIMITMLVSFPILCLISVPNLRGFICIIKSAKKIATNPSHGIIFVLVLYGHFDFNPVLYLRWIKVMQFVMHFYPCVSGTRTSPPAADDVANGSASPLSILRDKAVHWRHQEIGVLLR